ncbi:MAG TPA: DUF1569 domain-containing protein [Bacteroidia bacterium]|nr:DUF1569 domain-containing protein [Bacteroidia bacterium]
MKNNLLNSDAKTAMMARIAKLQPGMPALWGKMNVAQVLCHLADQFRMALGEIPVAGKAGFMGRTFMKWLVLAGMPAPKGKIQTMPELDQLTGGTKPTDFEKDRQILYAYIDIMVAKGNDYPWAAHPSFGPMNQTEWCRMGWIHLNHHLAQFGV